MPPTDDAGAVGKQLGAYAVASVSTEVASPLPAFPSRPFLPPADYLSNICWDLGAESSTVSNNLKMIDAIEMKGMKVVKPSIGTT